MIMRVTLQDPTLCTLTLARIFSILFDSFPVERTRKTCLTVKTFFKWRSFFLTLVNLIMCDSEVILSGEIKCETLSCIKEFKGGQSIHQYSFHTKYCL